MNCEKCRNLGIVRVQNKEESLDSLAYCGCSWSSGPSMIWKIARMNQRIAQAFEVTPVPVVWLRPDAEKRSVPRGSLISTIEGKAEEWALRVREAEKFWADWGTVFAEHKEHWTEKY